MNQPIELSLEQEFSLRTFSDQVQHMSHEQAQEFLLMLYKQMMIRETTYQELLKHQWELDSGSILG
ncbi:phycobilisome degradation family protein [Nostoc sp. 'Peltigera membranacea cyanobiont' 213]|uniref:Phycobilisome degradation family protein n=1 Tax=Nostoc punctiforme NIES-2108 TaxID=1356359 RepID=A0A367RZK6_NOSPU|nr:MULTISPECIES: NblA/ycf18 family protein [unclassified Nostoc]RCJ41143.1 phycobilisome degradation family protein [Nostoc punctiforme NIES-2108]AVH66252.1 phycobilisome degradation protein NblA [Nostoc sp. 'Peltigera membranacea cyanobiont' N6]MBN3926721.1 NblA/ycf18 family protein [Nostoc sp. NMS4]OYD87696.1 phycobilisome degradation family protein [Nostoc sp. 'Peltigera membranacea cyanobiont' 213]QLE45317.1 phycobilisome degradation family protein [Nostoc sp. C052]